MGLYATLTRIRPSDIEDLAKYFENRHDAKRPSLSLDKAWHAIHFLLTGSPQKGAPPLNFLCAGGSLVGRDYTLSAELTELAARGDALTAEEQARHAFLAGENAARDDRWKAAAESFRRAYELSGTYSALYHLVSVLDTQGRRTEMAALLEQFVAEHPDHPEAEEARRMAKEARRSQAELADDDDYDDYDDDQDDDDDDDQDDGTPSFERIRVLNPMEVKALSEALAPIDEDQLLKRFDPEVFKREGIYPSTIWEDPDVIDDYVLSFFREMKRFIAKAAKGGDGLEISVG